MYFISIYFGGDTFLRFTKKIQQVATVYQNFISYLYEPQRVSGNTPAIVRSLKAVQQLHVQQPSTYAKLEAASAVLGSWRWAVCRPKHVELYINMK